MSLQEIEVTNVKSATEGVKRTLADGSLGLILDTLQITQYIMPIDSTVRELASNAVDSQKEKNTAIKILKGEIKKEDVFVERKGEKYKDSKWDPSYFDLNHLDLNNNRVQLVYKQNTGSGYSDRFSVTDFGVGLGMPRLEGYFQLGYSTKRNAKEMLGAFGFGNKVALSTRCDFYEVETVHNGKLYRFSCGSHKVDSLIGKFNMEKGIENGSIQFSTGHTIYYESTTSKNYTKVTVPVKRINRQKFEHAVRNQLMYFNNIDFKVISEDGYDYDKQIKANVLHSSKHLLISDTNVYNRPHVVIVKDNTEESTTGVCYGYIDFEELEMQNLYGPIGFKCPIHSVIRDEETGVETIIQEGVSVTPSRESVIWDEITKSYITKVILEAKAEATSIVAKSLVESNIAKWLVKAETVLASGSSSNRVLYNLSRIVDTNELTPTFNNTNIKYGSPTTFLGASSEFVRLDTFSKYENGASTTKVSRNACSGWGNLQNSVVYLKSEEDRFVYKRDRYLIEVNKNSGGTTVISEPSIKALTEIYDKLEKKPQRFTKEGWIKHNYDRARMLYDSLVADGHKLYSSVVIPPDWESRLDEEEQEVKSAEFKAVLTPKELRELNGSTLIHGLSFNYYQGYNPKTFKDGDEDLVIEFTAKKQEVKPVDLTNYEGELYYGFTEDFADLHAAALITTERAAKDEEGRIKHSNSHNTWNNSIKDLPKIIKVNKGMKKFLEKSGHKHISEFFWTEDSEGNLTMSNNMKNYITASRMHDLISSVSYLKYFENIQPEAYTLYKELKLFLNLHIGKMNSSSVASHSAVVLANKLADFELFCRDHEDAETIKNKSMELFTVDLEGVTSGMNLEIWDKFLILQEYCEGLGLLEHLDLARSGPSTEIADYLSEYLQLKQKLQFKFK